MGGVDVGHEELAVCQAQEIRGAVAPLCGRGRLGHQHAGAPPGCAVVRRRYTHDTTVPGIRHEQRIEYHGTDISRARKAFPEIAEFIVNPWLYTQP